VVGAGAAGLALATRLLERGRPALLVESGGLRHDPALDDLDAAESVGAVNHGLREGRRRGLGGATQLWPGQCMRLPCDVVDARPWLGSDGWPLRYEELVAHYEAAERLLGLVPGELGGDVWTLLGLEPPPLPSLETRFSIFAPRPSLARALLPELRRSRSVDLLLHATAAPARAAAGRVEALELRAAGGRRATVRAVHYVLAAGTIENARLLLLFGGGGDAAGRYLQDHLFAPFARIASPDSKRLVHWFALHHRGRVRYYPKLALAAGERRVAGIGDALVNVVYPVSPAVAAALAARRALRAGRAPAARDVTAALRGSGDVLALARTRYLRGRSGVGDPARPSLAAVVEQPPRPESRVLLSTGRDALGMPRARVDWRVGEQERRTFAAVAQRTREELDAAGLGWAEPGSWLDEPARWPAAAHDSFHHTGTTRMSAAAEGGAVDPDCRVHDVANLWVAGASVFPAAGAASPTLTIVALALRLADRLARGPA